MTAFIVLNIAFAAIVLAGLGGLLGWALATQRRDLGITLERRARRPRAGAGVGTERRADTPPPAARWGAATRRRAWPAV